MKNILRILFITTLFSFFLQSCRDDNDVSWTTKAPSFKLYDTTLGSNVLYPTMENNPFQLVWEKFGTTNKYDIVFSDTSDFAKTITLATTTTNSYKTTIGELNTALLQAGYSPYASKQMYLRIQTAGTGTDISVSNTIAFTVTPYPVSVPVITSPSNGSAFILDGNAPNQVGATIRWNDYSYGIGVKYLVEISLSGANKFKTLGTVNDLKTLDVTNLDFNKALLSVGGVVGTVGSFDIRVTSITNLVTPGITKVSDIVTFKATPYQLTSYIYAPGGYQGWNPGSANTLVSATSNGVYIGYINFPNAGTEFKFTQNRDWSVNWGDNGADGTLDAGGSNILSAGAGYYKVNVDTNNLTYTMVPYSVGIVGAFSGWGSSPDVQMDWDDSILKFKATVTLPAGEFKFRINGDWTENYGDNGADGTLDPSGSNINLTSAGTYTITFDPFNQVYTIN